MFWYVQFLGVPSTQVKQEKPAAAENANVVKVSAAGKQKVKIVEPNKVVKTDDDESSYDEDAMSTDDSDDVEVSILVHLCMLFIDSFSELLYNCSKLIWLACFLYQWK